MEIGGDVEESDVGGVGAGKGEGILEDGVGGAEDPVGAGLSLGLGVDVEAGGEAVDGLSDAMDVAKTGGVAVAAGVGGFGFSEGSAGVGG